MLWKVNYIIDDGYTWHKKVCIIKANNKEKALEILDNEIGSKLKDGRIILRGYTEIIEWNYDVVIYNGPR